jgi:hypothetical protein
MQKRCKNPKCDYYGTSTCFSKACTERCSNRRCTMFGEVHFARSCRYRCENRECIKFSQYHPPGEICSDCNTFNTQSHPSQPFSYEGEQITAGLLRQTLSNMSQHSVFGNAHMLNQLTGFQQEPPPQIYQFGSNEQPPFYSNFGLPFFPPTSDNNVSRPPWSGSQPFGPY